MGLTLIAEPDTARALARGDDTDPVVAAILEAGGSIHPMPAFRSDEIGAQTFVIEAPDTLAPRLRDLPGVTSVMVKPDDHLP